MKKLIRMPFTLLHFANFNQGDEVFPAVARGRQCVPSSLMFLYTVNVIKPVEDIKAEDMDELLFSGSHLYCAFAEMNIVGVDGLLDPTSIAGHISYQTNKVYIVHRGVFAGSLMENAQSEEYNLSLENAFYQAACARTEKNFIIVFGGMALGIMYNQSRFYIFDSHSRDENGMACVDGKCILGYVETMPDLCSYLRCLSGLSANSSEPIQFDLHMYRFLKKYKKTAFSLRLLDNREGYRVNKPRKTSKQATQKEKHVDLPTSSDKLNKLSPPPTKKARYIEDLDNECFEELIRNFEHTVLSGPDYVCSCCTQTFFGHSVRKACNVRVNLSRFLNGFKSVDGFEWICCYCLECIRKDRIPKFWLHNGLQFPTRPEVLELSNLEERLVAPRLPFMQLREMPRGGQINLKGNVVNVPADVNGTIKMLPRMIDDSETIMLKLKRKLSYKHYVAFENIRPNKVFIAAKWLVSNSRLFQNEGIVVNETWLDLPLQNKVISCKPDKENDDDNVESCTASSEHWSEEENYLDRPTGNLDTCLQSADFREFNQILSVAPGEGNTPLGLFQDYDSEILSFPTIFCGQRRVDNSERHVPLYYSDICKWELRNVDRRVANSVPNLFFKLKRLQIKQLKDKVFLAVRKYKGKGMVITAGDLLSPGFVDKLTLQDDGYRVLRTIRGSPPYWEQARRDVFAMIRQLGIPTWFCSFSAAETKWVPLLKSLSKVVNGKELSTEEVEALSWQEKCKLIRSDPVTCARFFDYRVQSFIHNVLKHRLEPVGSVADYFYRVEFQQRGSPHIHIVIWIENAPVHGKSSDQSVVAFVDKYVACSKSEKVPELINYQTHRHAKTCRKHGKLVCRFNFPIPPMPETRILYPLKQNEVSASKNFDKIMEFLNKMRNSDTELEFKDFLSKLEMTYDVYIQAICCTLTRPKVFLKRMVSESRINNYNAVLLKCWKANMDIQYILDPYSCVSYIVSYISKGQRGLSNLLHDACEEARKIESDIRQRVRRIGNQFLSSVEIGAQEAVYLVLQMPLRRCTRDVVFLDTSKAGERTSLIKPLSDLKELPRNSKNIEMDSTLKRYKRRPISLEQVCYAYFASWYDLCAKSKRDTVADADIEELPETQYEHNKDDDICEEESHTPNGTVTLFCGTVLKKRLRQKVIYTHNIPFNQDREEHFRVQIMMYTHWRNDETDLKVDSESFEASYTRKLSEICANKQYFEKVESDIYEDIIQNSDNECITTVIHPEAQHLELLDKEEGIARPESLGCFDPGLPQNQPDEYDLGDDLGVGRKRVDDCSLPQKEVSNTDFIDSVRTLNLRQKQFFYHILHSVKTNQLPFYCFLSGGAGVGKTVVIKALNQALLKYYSHLRDGNPNSVKVLLCAPTGKAAHNIGGSTIHSAFCIPVSQGFQFKPLDMQQLNTMRARFHDLKIVIIDEISMVGRNMFNFINLRLQEIMACTKPFGNISILAVGDLFQLKPVMDSWLFSQKFRAAQIQCIASNLWVDHFELFELEEIMRQKEDRSFAELLNRLREGKHTDEDISVLKTRILPSSGEKLESISHLPHLFCTRSGASSHNGEVLSKLPKTQTINIDSIDTISGNVNNSLCDLILSKLPDDPSKTMGLHKNLQLGQGLPAELCLNIDTEDGLTNGAPCFIKMFDFRVENSSRCSIVWVEFEDQSVGKMWRSKYRHLYKDGIVLTWTPVLEACRKFNFQFHKTYLIVRRQFPLYLSAGKTIHKAQGSTINQAVMHFGSKKIDHIHYVGLSRVTSLTGVNILDINLAKISTSAEVVAEMERLRTHRLVSDSLPQLPQFNSNEMKICFHNCRSLRKHINNLKKEYNMLCCDIIVLVETRLCGVLPEEFSLDGFQHVSSNASEAAHGVIVYCKNNAQIEHCSIRTYSGIECALTLLKNGVVLGFVYCPPRQSTVENFQQFLIAINQDLDNVGLVDLSKVILMGDFNFEYQINNSVVQLFKNELSLRQLINFVTTDYGTCIDHLYTNLNPESLTWYGTLESYYSDHKPILVVFPVE